MKRNLERIVLNLCLAHIVSPAALWAQAPSNVQVQRLSSNFVSPTGELYPPGNQWLSVTATGTSLTYQWQFNGITFPAATSDLLYIPAPFSSIKSGTYTVLVSNPSGSASASINLTSTAGEVTGWGGTAAAIPPAPLDGVIGIACGTFHSLAVKANGTVLAWGDNSQNQCVVPTGLSKVVEVAGGCYHSLALKEDGTIVGWGSNANGESTPPASSGFIQIAAGLYDSLALKGDGTVVAWGLNTSGQASVPSWLSGVTAIAAGSYHNLALRSDGTVVAWGNNVWGQTNVPAGLTNVVAIAAGTHHSLALKSDGTLGAWGANEYGEISIPASATNIWKIAAGAFHSVALKNDCKTIIAWGLDGSGQTDVPAIKGVNDAVIQGNMQGVESISAGCYQTLALNSSAEFQYYPVDLSKDLLVVYNTNSMDSEAILNAYLAWRPQAASANILPIGCSTTDAIPGVNAPRVGECITVSHYQTQIAPTISSWLTNNPTKRPQYMVMLLGIPAKRADGPDQNGNYNLNVSSVSYTLSALDIPAGGWTCYHPLITHINMGDPYDDTGASDRGICYNYLSKLQFFSDLFSPGQAVISASAGGFGNQNYYFDDNSVLGNVPVGSRGVVGVLSADPTASVSYAPYNSQPVKAGVNLAGYFSWGAHNGAFDKFYALPDAGLPGKVLWDRGSCEWYIMATDESWNGRRSINTTDLGTFTSWFSTQAFGSTSSENTPVGAVGIAYEPNNFYMAEPFDYFGLWAAGRNFANCAWGSCQVTYFIQAVGDPLVRR